MVERRTVAAVALVVLVAQRATAQDFHIGRPPPSILAGAALEWAPNAGGLKEYVGPGWGADAHIAIGLTTNMLLAIRGEFGVTEYPARTVVRSVPQPGGSPVRVATRTDNSVTSGTVGLQITAPSGRVRPFAFATVGFAFLDTKSLLTNADSASPLAQREFRDGGFGAEAGGGIMIRLGSVNTPVLLDLSWVSTSADNVNLYTEKSITFVGSGFAPSISPVQGSWKAATYRLGVTFEFR